MRPPAIEARALVKRFGPVTALAGVDLRVQQGELFGLLGPNGAGKTTLVSVLATLARWDEGVASVLGHDLAREPAAARRAIGIVFQEPSLDPSLSAREQLDLQARLYHLDERSRRVAAALREAGLAEHAERAVRGFSGGMKRRLEIARGLLHRPRVLFLDEPTLGLDVEARAGIWRRLRELNAGGETTILLTTHSMEEADALCGRLAILDRGRVVAEGSPEVLKAELGGDTVVLRLERRESATEALEALEGVSRVVAEESAADLELRVTVSDGPRRLATLLDAVRPFGVQEVRLHRPTLEDVFRHHTGHVFEPAEDAA